MDNLKGFEGLVLLMDRLRGPDGCPWDREQTYETLRGYLVEECYETAAALDSGEPAALCEELGDLLFQIIFLARIAKEEEKFTIDDVIRGILEKMVRRHPHVFGDVSAETPREVLRNWETIKRQEKGGDHHEQGRPSALDGLPAGLPSLLHAERLGTRAARVGFDWERPGQVLEKIEEELAELRSAMERGERGSIRAEIGDMLFALAMLARHLEIDPEGALAGTNQRFTRRFQWIERELARRGEPIEEAGPERLEALWDEAKRSGY